MSKKETTDVPVEDQNVPEEHDPLTPETFSFIDTLAEKEYPSDTVEIFMDEVAAIELAKIAIKIDQIPESDPETLEVFLKDAVKWQKRLEKSMHLFRIRGVSDDTITDIREIAEAEFEGRKKPRRTANGQHLERILPESEQTNYVRYFNALVLSVHIEQIERTDGAVLTAPSAEEIATFIDKAPTAGKEKLQRAIAHLRARAEDFERKIDVDFLAKR
jgi:hypothetical protein